jgi:hypothetical protein
VPGRRGGHLTCCLLLLRVLDLAGAGLFAQLALFGGGGVGFFDLALLVASQALNCAGGWL